MPDYKRRRLTWNTNALTIPANTIVGEQADLGSPPAGGFWLVEGLSVYTARVAAGTVTYQSLFLYTASSEGINPPTGNIDPLLGVEGFDQYADKHGYSAAVVAGEHLFLQWIAEFTSSSSTMTLSVSVTIGEILNLAPGVKTPPDAITGIVPPPSYQ